MYGPTWTKLAAIAATTLVCIALAPFLPPADQTAGRWRDWRHRHDQPVPPNPTPTPTPIPPTPDPEPTPASCLIAIWHTIDAPEALSAAAHARELSAYLIDRGAQWRQIDPHVATQIPPPPPWVTDALNRATARRLDPPCLLLIKAGEITQTKQLTATDNTASIKAWLTQVLPAQVNATALNRPKRATGLLQRKTLAGKVLFHGRPIPRLSAILKPIPPDQYPTIDLTGQAPNPSDQGSDGTCSSHAATACLTSVRWTQVGPANYRPLSASCLATQISGWNGASLSDTMPALLTIGVCTLHTWPEGQHSGAPNWQAEAAGYKALEIYDTPSTDKMGYAMAALRRGWCVIIGISVGSGYDPDSTNYISYAKGHGSGGHAQLLIGHDATKKPGRSKVLNSWGPRWGVNGTAWIEDRFITDSPFDDVWTITTATIAPADTGPTIAPALPLPNCPGQACPNLVTR